MKRLFHIPEAEDILQPNLEIEEIQVVEASNKRRKVFSPLFLELKETIASSSKMKATQ